MASKQRAINTYRPQLRLEKTADLDWFMEFTEGRTGLTKGQLLLVVQELRDALIFFAREGRSFKLEGIGTFLPSIKLNGQLEVNFRLDNGIRKAVNKADAFRGEIVNKRNIGATLAALIAEWNVNYPDDPVVE